LELRSTISPWPQPIVKKAPSGAPRFSSGLGQASPQQLAVAEGVGVFVDVAVGVSVLVPVAVAV